MKTKSSERPYDCSAEEALENLLLAAARYGVSASGLVVSFATDLDVTQLKLWRGVVLSMLEGKKPPFKIGDKVVWTIGDKRIGKVSGVIYSGNDRWHISVYGINEDYDDGERFTPNGGSPRLLYAEDWSLVGS